MNLEHEDILSKIEKESDVNQTEEHPAPSEDQNESDDTAKFEALVKKKLDESYNNGVRVGILTVSKIVTDMLNDKKTPFMQRIDKVKRFCKVAPGIEDRYNKILAEETEKARQMMSEEDHSDATGDAT